MDNDRVNLSNVLHTTHVSCPLIYAICVYTATNELHNSPFSFPITGDKGKHHFPQHISPGVNVGLQWVKSLQFILHYTVLLLGKDPIPQAKNVTSNSFMNITNCEDPL